MENLVKRNLVVEGINYQFVADVKNEEITVTTESDDDFYMVAMGDQFLGEDIETEIAIVKARFESNDPAVLEQGFNWTSYGFLDCFSFDEDIVLLGVNHIAAIKAYLMANAIEFGRSLGFGDSSYMDPYNN